MSAPIIATKLLFPPPRSHLIPRPRLVERLAAGLRGPLTLISAPAGSGKTTLLSDWRTGPGRDIMDEVFSRQPGVIRDFLLQALALRAAIAGSRGAAAGQELACLERALTLAAPEGFARPLLDAGSALVNPLRQSILREIQPGFAHRLLAELAEEERRRATAGRVPGVSGLPGMSRLIEPLTEREQQVLRLLAAGLSSNEVAEELVISVSTARSYIKSLYAKLDAHSREEAIERGRESGLL